MADLDLTDLFDEADALAAEETPLPPDLPLPANYDVETPQRLMEMKDDSDNTSRSQRCGNGSRNGKGKGRGWYARQSIAAGTVLLVEKPLGMIMRLEEEDVEDDRDDTSMSVDDDEEDEEDMDSPAGGAIGTALLTIRLAESIQLDPKLWTEGIDQLYPRTEEETNALPPWVCSDPKVGLDMERCLSSLCEVAELNTIDRTISSGRNDADSNRRGGKTIAEQIRLRLPLIVRYNALSVETAPELFVHPGPVGHASLSGTALFLAASLFNHSSRPNVSRWALGDVTFFVANQDVKRGCELCISYVEHEILCENEQRRTAVLGMDFADDDIEDDENDNMEKMIDDMKKDDNENGKDGAKEDEEVPIMPVVDAEVQQELMDMPPAERLEAIDQLLAQAEGSNTHHAMEDGYEKNDPNDEDDEGGDDAPWFQCDAHELRILQALTLDGMGQHEEALPIWQSCVDFVDVNMPPIDESGIALRVQTALCAWTLGREKDAHKHAQRAMKDHAILFGGGPERFRRRYRRELELNLRPDAKKRPVRGIKVMRKLFPVS